MRSLLVALASIALATAAVEAAPQRAQKTRSAQKVRPGAKPVAKPGGKGKAASAPKPRKPRDPKYVQKLGSNAHVAFARAGELRPARESLAAARGAEPITAEEETAEQIQKLLRGPLRSGVTGLFVADAKTGEPLFAVNADDPLNPASNVKMISTATALELLGPGFRYPTRLLGPTPVGGAIHGDLYLLGSHDPTLTRGHLDELAAAVAARGVTSIEGGITVGKDPTRDGLYRATVPIEIAAGEPGKPATATTPAGFDLVAVKVTATTGRTRKSRLTYKEEVATTAQGAPRITLTIGGTIGKGVVTTYPLWIRQRTATAAYSLIAALRARGITVSGDMKVKELGDFVGDTAAAGALPVELGRHDSAPVADIVAKINKWSINWLADRLIMTAAGLTARKPPSMELALEAMYAWLARNPRVARSGVVLDTGSGLSYRTQISSHELVSIVRSAAGFDAPAGADRAVSDAWLRSLSVAGTDGTLTHRFRGSASAGRIFGKTGTLSTVIALSGVLALDPQRPLAFALVTNADAPLSKPWVRRAHEQVLNEICKYISKTSRPEPTTTPPPGPPPPLPPVPAPAPAGDQPAPDEDAAEDAPEPADHAGHPAEGPPEYDRRLDLETLAPP